jgi:hypothetical protein
MMASSREREASMMLEELESGRNEMGGAVTVAAGNAKKRQSVKFDEAQLKTKEHESIFEEIVEELEREDDSPLQSHCKQPRRGSLQSVGSSTTSSISMADLVHEPTGPRPRRHSSFHSLQRSLHRRLHKEMKVYFQDNDHHKRNTVIEGLFQFQLSLNMSMASMDNLEEMDSGNLYRSCPILTYMNDEDEDSVDLHRVKRPSLSVVKDEGEYLDEEDDFELSDDEDFELNSSKSSVKRLSLKAADDLPKPIANRTYTLKLGGFDDQDEKPRAKKRTTSYAMLSMRLDDHPLAVLDDIRSASMSNLPTSKTGKSYLPESPVSQKPPSSKRLMMFKMSHDEGSLSRDNTDLTNCKTLSSNKDILSGSPPPLGEMPPERAMGIGRAA